MISKTPKNGWMWYSSCHPASVGCVAEGREQCECKHHISNGTEIHSFEDFQSAEDFWVSVTGDEKFSLGKNSW